VVVDALDYVPVELELADDDGGKVDPTGAQLIERHRLRARLPELLKHPQFVEFRSAPSARFLGSFSRAHAAVVGAGLVVASIGETNRDSPRRLATAEHHAAARRAAKREVWLGGACAPVLGRHAAALCALRSRRADLST
jgi:hypothetical protein